ncbi:MAG: DNA gyrase subunit A [Bacteroidales bacterium]
MTDQERIIKINIEEEMKTAYIDYSMSVIVSRALPDVRDGFKPVHRRVLFGMNELGNTADKPYKKCARIVGEVLGKYHPHGDSSVYMTLVRMAQEWSLRYTLVDGQGNFGSVDGDSPAAMRYTEARLSKIAEEMLRDIDKDTVDTQLNFDDTLREPTVLPTRIPNLLVNGASGIAVGMATNMPPHNLSEVIDATVAYIEDSEITVEGLMHYVKAPDFPTGAYIFGTSGVKEAFETGRGRIIMRAKAEIEVEDSGHEKIVVTEIPYLVNKATLIERIAELTGIKKCDHAVRIEGVSNVNDESDRHGMRIVVDLKRDANSGVVLNKLYKMSDLQSSFSVNNIALVKGRPKLLNLRDMIRYFVEHRQDVVIRRTNYELREAEKRAHILQGLIVAVNNIDEVIQIIKDSTSPQSAMERLQERFELSDLQTRAIVDMRLRQLTGLEIDKLRKEFNELMAVIEKLKLILENHEELMRVIKEELVEIRAKYGDVRKSEIVLNSEDFNPEDFYADDEMIITISHLGYIKRTPLSEFRAQNRGGVGSKGGSTRDADFIEYIYPASMHSTMMFFTERGRCFWLKVYEIPEGSKTSKGRAIVNLLPALEKDEKVNAFIRVKGLNDSDYINNHYLVFCTQNGIIKKTLLEQYSRPRRNGVNAINLLEDDKLIQVRLTNGKSNIILANRNGRAINFQEEKVRAMGRSATGVKGMKLDGQDDAVIGMITVEDPEKDTIMVVSEQGFGKRSQFDEYRETSRNAKGVKTMNITEKTGKLVAIKNVTDENDLMIINKSGVTIRLKVADVRIMGRATQGVRLINLEKRNDEIGSVTKVATMDDEDEERSDMLLSPEEINSQLEGESNTVETLPTKEESDNSTSEDDPQMTLF